jgi:hypothetical protein
LDADDISDPGRLAAQMAFLDSHPEVGVVGAQLSYMDEDGKWLQSPKSLPLRHDEIRSQLFAGNCVIMHPTVMMRRECIAAVGGYRCVLDAAEDIDLWLRLADRTQLANLPDRLLAYRLHQGQVSRAKVWQQRLAHDLALLSARRRQQGRPDPLDDLKAPPDLRSRDLTHDAQVDALIETYRFAAAADQGFGERGRAEPVLVAVRARLLHCGAKRATGLVHLVWRDAIARKRPGQMLRAMITGLTYHPWYFVRLAVRARRGLD